MPLLLSEFDASFRWTFFALANLVIILWTYKIVVPAKVGWTRFALAFPLFIVCYLVFTLFDYERPSDRNMVMHCSMNYLWLTPWKLTALSLNRGPLVKAYESGNFGAFVVALLLNVNVAFEAKPIAQEKKSDDSTSLSKANTCAHDDVKFAVIKCKGRTLIKELLSVVGRTTCKVFLMLFVAYLYNMQEKESLVKNALGAWYLYGLLSGLQDMSQFFSVLILNIKLQENFNQPYLADSFSDFWSRRWNLVMGTQLKELCYEPIIQGQWMAPRSYFEKRKVSMSRRLIGTFLTFLASGIVHVFILTTALPGHGVFWDYGLFFLISPFVVAIESLLKAYIRKSESRMKLVARVPKFSRIIFVHAFMQIMAHYVYFPSVHRVGIVDKSIDAMFSSFKLSSPNGSFDAMN